MVSTEHDQPCDHLRTLKESKNQMMSQRSTLIVCGGKTKKEKAIDPDSDVRSEAGSFKSVNSRKTQKRRKTSDSGWLALEMNMLARKLVGI